jgi:hypothetical protein
LLLETDVVTVDGGLPPRLRPNRTLFGERELAIHRAIWRFSFTIGGYAPTRFPLAAKSVSRSPKVKGAPGRQAVQVLAVVVILRWKIDILPAVPFRAVAVSSQIVAIAAA